MALSERGLAAVISFFPVVLISGVTSSVVSPLLVEMSNVSSAVGESLLIACVGIAVTLSFAIAVIHGGQKR